MGYIKISYHFIKGTRASTDFCPWGSWKQFSTDTEGELYSYEVIFHELRCYLPESKLNFFEIQRVSAPKPVEVTLYCAETYMSVKSFLCRYIIRITSNIQAALFMSSDAKD